MGIMIESAAVNTLTVSKPKEGGLSIIIYLYFPKIGVIEFFKTDSLVNILTNSISAPANLVSEGTISKKSISVLEMQCLIFVLFIKTSYINKICASINQRKYLVHVLKFKNQIGNPVGFDFSILNKFKKISGDIGAKYMVKRLKNRTKYIHVKSKKIFKDLDRISDFRG